MKKNLCAESPAILVQAPAHPMSGCDMIQNLKKCLDVAECPAGKELHQKRFGELLGAPKSTIHDWSHANLVEPIKRFLCGLERLTEVERAKFLSGICRRCPRLQDPQIAHDPGSVRALSALLNQPIGLTFVVGPEAARTYLVTAIGNSAAYRLRACGLDIHQPVDFVPVPGVSYLEAPCSLPQLRATFRLTWPTLMKAKSSILILNGIWLSLPETRLRIVKAAAQRHVLIADEPGLDFRRTNWQVPLTVVSIEMGARQNQKLHIEVHSYQPG